MILSARRSVIVSVRHWLADMLFYKSDKSLSFLLAALLILIGGLAFFVATQF